MAHSYISFKGENLRVGDFDLIALVFFIKRAAAQRGGCADLDNMFAAWTDSIESGGAGNIDLQLDVFLSKSNHIGMLLGVLRDAKITLERLPEIISPSYLEQLIDIKGVRFGGYKKTFLQNIIESFEEVIQRATNSD